MEFLTRGNSDPKGKPRVYISFLGSDRAYFDALAEDILACCDCALFYSAEDTTQEEHAARLQHMQLMVVAVTGRLLAGGNRCVDVELPLATRAGIPVLPIVVEEGLVEKFSQVFGQRQFLDKTQNDATAIPYERKLAGFLGDVLVGSELAEKIRAAFDAYIFLSYRKKDRKYAQELMGLIHSIPDCRDVAIWYDEYLVPGEDFNHAIARALEKCDVFALAVTPNLLQPGNYVLENEYPEAVRSGKPILAAELVSTDRTALEENFDGIPATVDAYEPEALADALRCQLRSIVLAENDNEPGHMFFIGLAYLNGIDVEVDREKALELIRKAALAGLPEAAKKLASMYRSGDGVLRDDYMSALWLEHYCRLLEPAFLDDPEKKATALEGFLQCHSFYLYRIVAKRGDFDSFNALQEWRTLTTGQLKSDSEAVLAYIRARWQWCDLLRSMGLTTMVNREEKLTCELARLLHGVKKEQEITACFVHALIRAGETFHEKDWKAVDELTGSTEALREQLECLLLTCESMSEQTYKTKERDAHFRRAGKVLVRLEEELPEPEAALLRIRFHHGMGRCERSGYSFSRRLDNPHNHKQLQLAYDLALQQEQSQEVLGLLRDICADRSECFRNPAKAMYWCRLAADYGRKLYETTRSREALQKLQKLTEALSELLWKTGDKVGAEECKRQRVLLGEGDKTDGEQEQVLRLLLKTYFEAAHTVDGDQRRHWLLRAVNLQNYEDRRLSDGGSLRLAGFAWLELGDHRRAGVLLEKAWLEAADEEACAALKLCGLTKYEEQGILFASWLPGADLEALADRAQAAGLDALSRALRGQPDQTASRPLHYYALRDTDPWNAVDSLQQAMERMEAGRLLPLYADEDMDVRTVVSHSALGLCAGALLAGIGEDEDALELLENAAIQLRRILEERECSGAQKVLLLTLEQLLPLQERLGLVRAAGLKQEYRDLLLKQAQHSGEEAQLRRVCDLVVEQGFPREREVAAALRLVRLSGKNEDMHTLVRLAACTNLDGVEGGILAEQAILVAEQLLRRGDRRAVTPLARLLDRSTKNEPRRSAVLLGRMERIAGLLAPLEGELEAEDAVALHRAWFLLGEREKCRALERSVLDRPRDLEQCRAAVRFAMDCLENSDDHFVSKEEATALLEWTVNLVHSRTEGVTDYEWCVQLAAIFQYCAQQAGGAWQERTNALMERLVETIDGIPNENTRLEYLEGCGVILMNGGFFDRAEACFVKLTGALQKQYNREVALEKYCTLCSMLGLDMLKHGLTDRSKLWLRNALAGRFRLLEIDPSSHNRMEFMVEADMIAECLPEKDKKLFYPWFGAFVKMAVELILEQGENPADDVAEIARCLLLPRYFLWAARLNLRFREWGEAWWNLTCIPTAWYMKHFVKSAKGGKKEGSL